MAIRKDILDFPFHAKDRGVWYFITCWEKRITLEFYGANKDDLMEWLRNCIALGATKNYTMFGVWTGEWKTDIFEMPIEQAYEKLSVHFTKPIIPSSDTEIKLVGNKIESLISDSCKENIAHYKLGKMLKTQCKHKAVKDGYCKIHHPTEVKKRQDKRAKLVQEELAKHIR